MRGNRPNALLTHVILSLVTPVVTLDASYLNFLCALSHSRLRKVSRLLGVSNVRRNLLESYLIS